MKEVTDPALIADLERSPVTDPQLIAELEGKPKRSADLLSALYGFMRQKQGESRDLVGGALRGAAGIGSVLIDPFDSQARQQRNAATEGGLNELGFPTSGAGYEAGKLGAEIAGTLGAGPGLAKTGAAIVPKLAQSSLLKAVQTSGMAGGNAATRAAGGAVTGATQAGMIDPENADVGALIGAAGPLAIQLAGKTGQAVGRVFGGPAVQPSAVNAAEEAAKAGYVIPPTQVKPSLINRLLEGFSGKLTTAQNASARNQPVTNRIVNEALGLPAETQLSHEVLNAVRAKAGQAYDVVRNAGEVVPGQKYIDALDEIVKPYMNITKGFPNSRQHPIISAIDEVRSTRFDASSAVDKIIDLRDQASAAYSKGDKSVGKALKRAADALEATLDDHLVNIGAPAETLDNFRKARQLIAKTYSAESALNLATGSVDAAKLGRQIQAGKPLTGGLKTAGDFALQFPTAAKVTERMGSLPQLSPLDWAVGAIGAGNYAMGDGNAQNLWPAALMFARPAARAAALSGPVQRGLLNASAPGLLSGLDWQTALLRSLPAIAADR